MIDGTVVVGDRKYLIETIIAEGGFGYVHKVRDVESNNYYALKKINSNDKETLSEIENEIEILQSLQKHPHIMEFIAFAKLSPTQSMNNSDNTTNSNSKTNSNKLTYLILCEYCDRGTLADLELPIQELERSCRIIYQVASALKHIHDKGIIHRDIKAENVLFDASGRVKLCDFGSSTRHKYQPDIGWTPLERSTVEDEMQRHTTPLYRPPEILETYLHYPINCAIDVWALGCLVYFMRFGQHAFPDSGKLSIVNCCYSIPKDVSSNDPLVSVIKQCLKADPNERITVQALINSLEVEFKDMELTGSVVPFTPKRPPRGNAPTNCQVQDSPVKSNDNLDKKQQDQSNVEPSDRTIEDTSQSPQETASSKSSVALTSKSKPTTPTKNDKQSTTSKVDTLVEFGNTSSTSASSFENSKRLPSADSILNELSDPAKRAGLTEELLRTQPGANVNASKNIDNLLDMDLLNSNNLTDQKILSPKKTSFTNKSNNPNEKRNVFDDLLESFGTALPSNGTLNNNKQSILGSTCDYDDFGLDPKLKITEWRDNRRGNIRALLSSLHLVLSEEFRWKQVGMHQLVTDADVKKIYRSACLAVHPDKVVNCDDETKDVAKMVFTELNEAWSKFEGR